MPLSTFVVSIDACLNLQVSGVTAPDSEEQVKFSQEVTVVAEDYVVV